jgi:TPR repeat protein
VQATVKKENRPQPIILNPDIFDPQPKEPEIIELSDSNYEKGFRAYKSGDYAAAFELLKTETRYSIVRATLGFMYFSGLGVTQDYSKAVEWFVAAAQQGHVVAQKNLGSIYAGGYGLPQDYREAARWYLMAAESNDAIAQKRLADMHILGLGVTPDKRQAVKWYRRAAENGDETAARYADDFVDQKLEDCKAVLILDLGLEPSYPALIDGAEVD